MLYDCILRGKRALCTCQLKGTVEKGKPKIMVYDNKQSEEGTGGAKRIWVHFGHNCLLEEFHDQ